MLTPTPFDRNTVSFHASVLFGGYPPHTARGAQFNLFLLPSLITSFSNISRCPYCSGFEVPGSRRLGIYPSFRCPFLPTLARFALGHTVKELVSRGLKSRSGDDHHDRRFVSRSPSVVATAKPRSLLPGRSIHFVSISGKIFANEPEPLKTREMPGTSRPEKTVLLDSGT